MTIVLVDPRDPTVRIVLDGQFAEYDADVLLRTFPWLRVCKTPDQPPLFALDEPRAEQGSLFEGIP